MEFLLIESLGISLYTVILHCTYFCGVGATDLGPQGPLVHWYWCISKPNGSILWFVCCVVKLKWHFSLINYGQENKYL